jgi:hypothetical protein
MKEMDELFNVVKEFCDVEGVPVPNMYKEILVRGHSMPLTRVTR